MFFSFLVPDQIYPMGARSDFLNQALLDQRRSVYRYDSARMLPKTAHIC